jgi:hypothetical protein
MHTARIISTGNEYIDTASTITPDTWSAVDVGGFDSASATARGGNLWALLDYLGYQLVIFSPSGVEVWRGKITTVRVQEPGMSAGLTIDELANRVRIEYVVSDANGKNEKRVTAWLEDADSIQRYGVREMSETLGNASDDQAIRFCAQVLRDRRQPMPDMGIGGGGERMATIEAEGHYHELGNVYYADDTGIVQHDASSDTATPLGYSITTNELRFSAGNSIYDFGGQTAGLAEGTEITISGGSNTGRAVLTSEVQKFQTYTSPIIAFHETQTITDSSNGLSFLTGARWMKISGSVRNSGYWLVTGGGNPGTQKVEPLTIRNESGLAVTLTRPQAWRTDREFLEQVQGATITITAGAIRIAQSLTIPQTQAWPVGEVDIFLQKVGAPGDDVIVRLMSDSGGGQPLSTLATARKPAADIASSMAWRTFQFDTRYTLAPGVRYWLEISRAGAANGQHYYQVGMDSTESYDGGRALYHNGSAWLAQGVPADMVFVLRGAMETTTQIQRIVAACGSYIVGTELDGNQGSGIYSHQFRDGESDGWSEIEDLIAAGYANGQKMLATVTSGGRLRLHRMDALTSDPKFHYTAQGELRNAKGGPVEPGVVPVGEYAYIPEVEIPLNTRLNPFYMQRTEYQAGQGRYRIEAARHGNIWDVGGVRSG